MIKDWATLGPLFRHTAISQFPTLEATMHSGCLTMQSKAVGVEASGDLLLQIPSVSFHRDFPTDLNAGG